MWKNPHDIEKIVIQSVYYDPIFVKMKTINIS